MADAFETYLYQKGRALYVSPLSTLATRLNLLDILIKVGTEGFFFPSPVLFRVGSMLHLGTASSQEAQQELRQGLKRFWEGKGSTDETFFWSYGDVPAFGEILSSKSSVTSSLLAGLAEAKLQFSEASELKCVIGELDTACVKREAVGSMMAINPPRWKPNINDERLSIDDRPIFANSNVELWIVHDIMYAKTVAINSADSSSGSGKVCYLVPGNPSTAETSESSSPVINMTKTRESTNSLKLSAVAGKSPASRVPDKSMIAFRLVGFVFNSAGDFLGYKGDPGAAQPKHRAPGDGRSHSDQRAQIRDLYMETAPAYDSDEDDDEDEDDDDIAKRKTNFKTWYLQRLPIVDVDGDLDVPLDRGSGAISNPVLPYNTTDGGSFGIIPFWR